MRASSGLTVVLALTMTLLASTDVSAHRREDYLQAARIGLEPDSVLITLDLTPGIAVAESFMTALDHNRDGSLSTEEQREYARQVLSALEVEIDQRPLRPRVLSWSFPEPSAVRRGEGTIQLKVQATLPGLSAASHRLLFRNAHLTGHSAYLANALVPESARVAVTAQRRASDQSQLTIEYTVDADSPGATRAWVLGSLAAAFLMVRFRRAGLTFGGALLAVVFVLGGFVPTRARAQTPGVMLMNRIGPSTSELHVSRPDGSDERKLFAASSFDYHASYSPDGQWIVFTSERNGLGQADIYRARPDGTDVERLTDSPAVDDQGALSPDGTELAFVSTREMRTANVWILDLRTRRARSLTGQPGLQGDPSKPNGFFRPAWSPDGKWIAFSSDRNTEWRGHSSGAGWEHVQELSIYVVRPDGTGLRRLTPPGVCSGAPKWSPDGTRVVFYEIPVEQTWAAHWPRLDASTTSQVVSVHVESGKREVHTAGAGLKVLPQFVTNGVIGYLAKAGPKQGLAYTSGAGPVAGEMRSPAWSPDGKHVVYERVGFRPRPQNLLLYSWDPDYEYRYTDVFPSFSKDGKLLVTRKDGDSSLDIMDPDGSHRQEVFPSKGGTAFSPSWSPDGQSIVFGYGGFLQSRNGQSAKVMMVRRDGTNVTPLSEGLPNAGFPSFSADGTRIVYRVWGTDAQGLRILNLSDRSVQVLTTDYDNLPYWSPDGQRIVFTRRHSGFNFDIFTIRPDGSDLRQLTTSPANDGHAVWSDDGRHIMWNSGVYGWKEEAALYDRTFQPYGQIFIMKADGSEKRPLTDSLWEDSMPVFVPKAGKGGATP